MKPVSRKAASRYVFELAAAEREAVGVDAAVQGRRGFGRVAERGGGEVGQHQGLEDRDLVDAAAYLVDVDGLACFVDRDAGEFAGGRSGRELLDQAPVGVVAVDRLFVGDVEVMAAAVDRDR